MQPRRHGGPHLDTSAGQGAATSPPSDRRRSGWSWHGHWRLTVAITRYEATRGNLVAPRLLVDAIVPALDALALVIATVAARPSAAGAACAVGFYLALAA